jgi:hypothetical protein
VKKTLDYIIYGFAAIGFILTIGFVAIKLDLTKEKGMIDKQKYSFVISNSQNVAHPENASSTYEWKNTEDWKALKIAITKDREAIYKASTVFDIKPRIIVSIIMVEQMRLFGDNREVFKTIFAPLKILGVQNQFSWGVVGIKEETAITTEKNLKASTSPFYPGKKYENLLDFYTKEVDSERFERLTNEKDRLYSYLYTAAIIKQLETQWKNAGYPIDAKPAILSTLFNIGFIHSKPNNNPKSGGAVITINAKDYSFGSLAHEFYYSNELIEIFPR